MEENHDDDRIDERQTNIVVNIPPQFFSELTDFLRASKYTARMASIRSMIGLGISLIFVYFLFISGGNGPGAGLSSSPYSMIKERLNTVAIPGETLKADNLPETPVVSGTFVIVDIKGIIAESDLSFQDKLSRLEVASREPNLKAVILDINSPGGTVSGSEKLREEVLRLKKLGIKVIAFYNGIAASGACYMSVDADYIIATRSSMVGSIGVIFSWMNISGLMDRYGVKMEVFKSGPFKDMGSYARNPSPEEIKLLQEIVNESFERFVGIVAQGRHLSRNEVLSFANGSVFSPAKALRYGLIDKVTDNGMRDAVLMAMELTKVNSPLVLRPHRAPQGVFQLLSSKLSFSRSNVEEKIADIIVQTPVLKYEWRSP